MKTQQGWQYILSIQRANLPRWTQGSLRTSTTEEHALLLLSNDGGDAKVQGLVFGSGKGTSLNSYPSRLFFGGEGGGVQSKDEGDTHPSVQRCMNHRSTRANLRIDNPTPRNASTIAIFNFSRCKISRVFFFCIFAKLLGDIVFYQWIWSENCIEIVIGKYRPCRRFLIIFSTRFNNSYLSLMQDEASATRVQDMQHPTMDSTIPSPEIQVHIDNLKHAKITNHLESFDRDFKQWTKMWCCRFGQLGGNFRIFYSFDKNHFRREKRFTSPFAPRILLVRVKINLPRSELKNGTQNITKRARHTRRWYAYRQTKDSLDFDLFFTFSLVFLWKGKIEIKNWNELVKVE